MGSQEHIKKGTWDEQASGVFSKIYSRKKQRGPEDKLEMEKLEFGNLQEVVRKYLGKIRLKGQCIGDESKELDLILDLVDRRAKEVDSREKQVDRRDKVLGEVHQNIKEHYKQLEIKLQRQSKELSSIQGSIDKRVEELDSRENQVKVREKQAEEILKNNEEHCKKLEVKDRLKELDLVRDSIDQWARELDSREQEVEAREEQIEDIPKINKEHLNEFEAKLQGHLKELDLIRDSIEHRARELDSREKQLKEMHKINKEHLEAKFQGHLKELDLIRDSIEHRARELDSREKQLKEMHKINEEQCKELEVSIRDQTKELISVRALIEKQVKELDLRGKQVKAGEEHLKEMCKNSEDHWEEPEVKVQSNDLDLVQNLTEKRIKGLELRENQLKREREKELDLVQKLNEMRSDKLEMEAYVENSNEKRDEELCLEEEQLNSVLRKRKRQGSSLSSATKFTASTDSVIEGYQTCLDVAAKHGLPICIQEIIQNQYEALLMTNDPTHGRSNISKLLKDVCNEMSEVMASVKVVQKVNMPDIKAVAELRYHHAKLSKLLEEVRKEKADLVVKIKITEENVQELGVVNEDLVQKLSLQNPTTIAFCLEDDDAPSSNCV